MYVIDIDRYNMLSEWKETPGTFLPESGYE